MYSYSMSRVNIKGMFDKKIIFFFFCLRISQATAVDVDYLIDNGISQHNILREQENDSCYSTLHKLYCNLKCGTKIGLCIEKHCYCVFAVQARRKDSPQMIYLARPDDHSSDRYLRFDDNRKDVDDVLSRALDDESVDMDESLNFSFRPALRHHIAHFCPNLDVARECIRTCMKEGKPAFCGKDHICYCGHKYNSWDDTSNKNLAETYGQFRDLYEKYFGTHHNPERIEKKSKLE